jgi:hypothetical protein
VDRFVRGRRFRQNGDNCNFLSASMNPDAARLLHTARSGLRVGTVVGDCRQRGRKSSSMLPSSRRAPLHHDQTDDGDDAPGRPADAFHCSDHLPVLSGIHCDARGAGPGADCGSGKLAGDEDADVHGSCGPRGSFFSSERRTCRPWSSRDEAKLILTQRSLSSN